MGSIVGEVLELGNTALIGKDDKVDQYDYSTSRTLTLTSGDLATGYIDAVALFSQEDGTGAVQTPTGRLVFFDATPALTAGDQNLTVAQAKAVIGQVDIASGNWFTEGAGTAIAAFAYNRLASPIPFHAVQYLYVAWYNTGATGLNDAAGDDEAISLNLWYTRVS